MVVTGQCNKKATAKARELNYNTLISSGLGSVVYELRFWFSFFLVVLK